jgi:AcrR family transcriptional regulator
MGRPKKFNREGVLDRAIPVFWKHGFADTTVQHLEQATGVNKSGLYTEFKDKAEALSDGELCSSGSGSDDERLQPE